MGDFPCISFLIG